MSKKLNPESLMMSYGYKPELSEGAIKCPIFQTSTFVFKTAEEGKAFFEVAYGKREKGVNEELGLIYSRLNNPDLEILENRLCLWDEAEDCAVFESGMSAISTVLLEFLKPGDTILYALPLYGGTDHFIHHFLPSIGVKVHGFKAGMSKNEILAKLEKEQVDLRSLKMIYLETPANPTNDLIDISLLREFANDIKQEEDILIAVDNTYMGPLWQHPLKHGADFVIYSATKYIGGHSDVIAGAVLCSRELMSRVKTLRTFLGNMAGPWTGWLLMRSLETLKVRMEQQQSNAVKVSEHLAKHPKIKSISYLGLLEEKDPSYPIFKKQCKGTGAMISFNVKGGEKEAFKVLNALKLIKLAVSLGSTESLAQHPKTMTHAGVEEASMEEMGIFDSLIRLSVGVENYEDIIWDLDQALEQI
ncbi:MAG: cystathionine gamma-synthase family protein [Chitinophagales bacterium]|nr:cystathionine gamma-synthase family protein [Bacteroidota bacterium]MCB9257599.1 cystathionine gamma-synthase family protein [Chitinophagales bacterium]